MTSVRSPADLLIELRAALRHPSAPVRAGASVALGRLHDVISTPRLLDALEDPEHLVRQGAGRGLGIMGAQAVEAILERLEGESGADYLQEASVALSRIRDPKAVDLLSAALNHLQAPARYGAAEALGAIRDDRAIPALIQAAHSGDPVFRQKAAQALLEIGAPQAVHALAALLDEGDPRLRQLAVRGLGRTRGPDAVLPLLAALSDSEERVRWEAADALLEIRAPGTADLLLTALITPSAWVQQSVADALGNFPEDGISDRLYKLATEEGELQTKLTAAQALARLGDERGTTLLLRTMNAPNRRTRLQASLALGLTGDLRALEPLLEALKTGSVDTSTPQGRMMRRQIGRAMLAIGEPAVLPLVSALAEAGPLLRSLATGTLLAMGPRAVAALVNTLSAPGDAKTRTQAALLLGWIGHPSAIEPLSGVLRETLRGPYPLVFFSRLFFDPTAGLRVAAAASLGRIDTQDGASLLLSAARFDPDPAVNEEAKRALALTGAPAVIARFAELDVSGFINRALTAGAGMALVAAMAGFAGLKWGLPAAAPLAGLAAGFALGLADGLEGRKRPLQGALLGAAAAITLAWTLSGTTSSWVFSLASALLPALGALTGWGRIQPMQRLAGMFGGMVLGFMGAGIVALLFGG